MLNWEQFFPASFSCLHFKERQAAENLRRKILEIFHHLKMSGRGQTRKDAPRIRRSKRQAEASDRGDSQKKQKNAAQHAEQDHEVVETISLNGHTQVDSSGIGISQERPEGIIHFDNIFNDFAGEIQEIEPLRCGDEDLTLHLPKQIIEKIFNQQYTNLAMLLKGSIELPELCSGGTLHINEKGCIESRPKISKQSIRSIDEWTDAFIIFSSVYLNKFTEKNIEILKYMSVIREAATRYPSSAWVSYDQQFRLRQANELTRQSWGSLNGELWLRVMSNPAQNNSMLKRSAASAPNNGQSKTCNAFNEGNCT